MKINNKHKDTIILYSRNIFFLGIGLFILEIFTPLIVSNLININIIVIITLFSFIIWILFYLKKDEAKYKAKVGLFLKYGFIIVLFFILLSSFNFDFIENIEVLNLIITAISGHFAPLGFTALGFGFLSFYFSKRKINQNTQHLKTKEEQVEESRKKDFNYKFPRISKIWGLGSVIKWIYVEGWVYGIFSIIIPLLFLAFGSVHLGQFMSVDEPKWLNTRVPQLFEALRSGDWAQTYINDKPGVLPSLLAGITNFFINPESYGPQDLEHYLFWWRFPVLFFNFIMLFFIYYFTKKLINKKYALLTTGLIALNPIIIGISQIINPDATLWSVAFLSFITFLLYLKTNKSKYIWFSGIFFGLALISKYFVSIFYILFFVVIYIEYLSGKISRENFFQRCLDLGKIYVISIFIYVLLFPVTWVEPIQILKGTIGANILQAGIPFFLFFMFLTFFELIVLKGKFTKNIHKIINIKKIFLICFGVIFLASFFLLLLNTLLDYSIFDPDEYRYYLFERGVLNIGSDLMSSGYVVLFSLTYPLLLSLFFSPMFFVLQKRSCFQMEKTILISIYLLTVLFLGGAAFGGFIATARYQIILYPLYCLLAAILFFRIFKHKIIIPILIVSSIIITYSTIPFYYHYNNHLNIHNSIVTEAWGYGGYELAQKLNSLPNAKEITVWTDREGFNDFFIGKSYWRDRYNPFDETYDIDYLILTRGGKRIFSSALEQYNEGATYLYAIVAGEHGILDYYKKEAEFIVYINDNQNNFIKAVRFDK